MQRIAFGDEGLFRGWWLSGACIRFGPLVIDDTADLAANHPITATDGRPVGKDIHAENVKGARGNGPLRIA